MNILNVEKLVKDQSLLYKDKMLSQYSRLLDNPAPSFPIIYSIDGVNSTAELGTVDIMEYVGNNSPIRFRKIMNAPLFITDSISESTTFDETLGTYTDYDGEALSLKSVYQPKPGDHFIVKEFNPEVIFCITDVTVRNIRGSDHYIVKFSVVSSSRLLNIERQVVENYETVYRNIGTEDKVIIRKSDYDILQQYIGTYAKIVDRYLDEYYDEHYDYIKTPDMLSEYSGYGSCKYLLKFLMDNRILYFDEILELVFAFELVLPFESKHNKTYARTFPLINFVKKTFSFYHQYKI